MMVEIYGRMDIMSKLFTEVRYNFRNSKMQLSKPLGIIRVRLFSRMVYPILSGGFILLFLRSINSPEVYPLLSNTSLDPMRNKSFGHAEYYQENELRPQDADPVNSNDALTYSFHPLSPLPSRANANLAPFNGTFMQPKTLGLAEIPKYFSEIHELGMEIVILQNIRTKDPGCIGEECCESADYRWLQGFPGKLGLILNQAAEYGIDIYVGLDLTSHGLCPKTFYEEPNSSLTIEDTRKTIIQMVSIYGDHPALAGWYLPDEPSLGEWIQPELTYGYYTGLVNTIKRVSSKPILVSPHLIGANFLTPEDLAYRAYSFRSFTGVDILLWQDAAGAEGAKLKWSPLSRSFGEYLSKIVEYLGKDATWTVHEAFNCCVISSELADGAAYHPASIVRILEQLKEIQSIPVGKKITWIQQYHFGSVDPARHLEAERLLDAYKAQFGLSGEYLTPVSYSWKNDPDPLYEDQGFEMFNLRTGNPKDFNNREWVGIDGEQYGQAEIVIDLGTEKTLKWVGFHLLSIPTVGIEFPSELSLACMTLGKNWRGLDTWYLPIRQEDSTSEYLFSNFRSLDVDCKMLKASLVGNHWIFISEIEIIASSLEVNPLNAIPRNELLIP